MSKCVNILLLGLIFTCISCHDAEFLDPNTSFIIFGSFGKHCREDCDEYFRLESTRLLKLEDRDFAFDQFYVTNSFLILSDEKFEKVNDLLNFIPQELLDDPSFHIGQPEVSDVGALYFEIKDESKHRVWILEEGDFDMPPEYRTFMDKINEKLVLIHQ
jgi:hypothetical protein